MIEFNETAIKLKCIGQCSLHFSYFARDKIEN